MGAPDDKDPGKKNRPARDGVRHDARGNAVWQWAMDSGRHLIENTSLLLKRLEVPGLKLEEDVSAQEKRSAAKPEPSAGPAPGAGYDPYGNKRVAPTSAARPPATTCKPCCAAR